MCREVLILRRPYDPAFSNLKKDVPCLYLYGISLLLIKLSSTVRPTMYRFYFRFMLSRDLARIQASVCLLCAIIFQAYESPAVFVSLTLQGSC